MLLTPDGDGLVYEERGRLRFGSFEGEATCTLRYRIDGGRLDVAFPDGRSFFAAELSSGRACVSHSCPPDDYVGEIKIADVDRWRQVWRVTGPRKRLLIATLYQRDTPR
jgi:hypothetical protein